MLWYVGEKKYKTTSVGNNYATKYDAFLGVSKAAHPLIAGGHARPTKTGLGGWMGWSPDTLTRFH